MDVLEQLSEYRHVEPVDDHVVAAVVEMIASALSGRHPLGLGGRRSRRGSRRLRPGRRLAAATGAAVVVLAAGGGLAAATGLFQSSPTPLPSALSFLSAPDPAKTPGVTVQSSLAGPEGTTFRVVTDILTVDNRTDTCIALAIEGRDGQAIPHSPPGMCELLQALPGQAMPQIRQVTPGIGLSQWRAPSGATYYVIFGQGVPGLANVAVTDDHGSPAASEPATSGGYAIYIPAAALTSHSQIVFTDKSGKILSEQHLNAEPSH